jgi:5-hydroxyisourate hydrolase-like protein (transthyretin family)
MKTLRPLLAVATFLSKLIACAVLLLLAQFALSVVVSAQTPTTLQGLATYSYPDNSLHPAAGVTVTMTKTVDDVSPPVVSTETTTTDGSGHYSFQSVFRCSVSYSFQAVSSEIVDDEPLPPSGISSTSGCVGNATLHILNIRKPVLITLGGYVLEHGNHVQGVTVTMTRTKYDLNPNVVTTATTSTDANGHFQFITFSRCAVVELFKPSIGSYTFGSFISPSGCITGDHDNLNLNLNLNLARDAGSPECHGVGRPVNVTNGNVYLKQTDYYLPGIGEAIEVTRAYNSSSQTLGLFGRGWTSVYDETVTPASGNLLDFRMADGRVVTSEITPDFFGQIVKNGDGSYTVTFKDGRTHQFNSSGKLLSLRDRNGNQTTLT